MRIQGLHLKGLRIPPGEQRLGFDAGYNVVIAGAAGEALQRLLVALLYPLHSPHALEAAGLGPRASETEPAGAAEPAPDGDAVDGPGEARARAILALSEKSGNYRVVADLARARVALARYDVSGRRYERVALDPVGVSERLRSLGLPELQDFLELNALGWPAAGVPGGPAASAEAVARPAAAAPRVAAPEPEDFDLEEAKRLAALRERVWGAEQELAHLRRALADSAWLARLAAAPEFERRLARLAALREAQAQDNAAHELARRDLLEERERLRSREPALRPFGFGLALGAALVLAVGAGVASDLRQLAPYAAAGVGLLWAAALALRATGLRRQLGVVDARLVALRLGEGSRGGTPPAELQELDRALAERRLGTEAVPRVLAEQRQQEHRCTELETELAEARRSLTPERLAWLAQCERALAGRARAARSAGRRAEASAAPLLRRCADPGALLAVAAASAKRSGAELAELLGPVLPLYVRALTGGRYAQLRLADAGWCLERVEPRAELPLANLAAPLRARVQLALQLALLEVLAPGARSPVLIGPGLRCGEGEEGHTLARALARLGSVRQVVHLCAQPGPFAECAHRVQRLSA